ncbi:HutD/Ves family protein [Allorhizobium taibaishanense]|uniref:HutD-family protein n=1 Tax=Allorhizobium taibaishanense TaxID=887144 RepID=A0A1Q9ABQ6_9HYPH|nr:HutD family protein [Allorhizobium taibaishanense]MBB4010603.1 hypothetical protein [Allorhizobium taibaishanense]OLP52295.1 hypothetical protein BJF91_24210 [Allorhizobium taibaishanense]
MQILRRETYRRMPWKNGQGMTEEIAIFPLESGMEDFDWRLSIAHVGADGPFSLFPGLDRSIALLDGEGMALSLPDGKSEMLTKTGQPFAFPGDWVISSRNLAAKTIDLNIMTRRGRFRHEMCRQQHFALATRSEAAITLVVFNQDVTVVDKDQPLSLHRFDTVILEPGEPWPFTASVPSDTTGCDLLVVTLEREE